MNKSFRKRLLAGEKLLGTMVTLNEPAVAEILSRVGFDWLFIDCEHGPFGTADLVGLLQAAGGATACIARVAGHGGGSDQAHAGRGRGWHYRATGEHGRAGRGGGAVFAVRAAGFARRGTGARAWVRTEVCRVRGESQRACDGDSASRARGSGGEH